MIVPQIINRFKSKKLMESSLSLSLSFDYDNPGGLDLHYAVRSFLGKGNIFKCDEKWRGRNLLL